MIINYFILSQVYLYDNSIRNITLKLYYLHCLIE
jgi:hypothetical protein